MSNVKCFTLAALVVQSCKSLFHGVLVKNATARVGFMLLALALSVPAVGQNSSSAQRTSQKSYEKYMKQQKKQQKKAEKEQKKATKKWNKQHHVGQA